MLNKRIIRGSQNWSGWITNVNHVQPLESHSNKSIVANNLNIKSFST